MKLFKSHMETHAITLKFCGGKPNSKTRYNLTSIYTQNYCMSEIAMHDMNLSINSF